MGVIVLLKKNKPNIKQLQQNALKRGRQLQYEEDLQELTKMTSRLHKQQLNEIEKIKKDADARVNKIFKDVEIQQKSESMKKLQKYKQFLIDKENTVKKQSELISNLRKENKRLKKVLEDTLILRKEITSVLDMQYNYYTTLENTMHTTRQQLTKMIHNMDIGEKSIRKKTDSIYNLLNELDESSDEEYVELIEKVE